MIAELGKTEDSYQAAFRALQASSSQAGLASWLLRLRESAMDRFEALGFPSVTEEEWKYTNVSPIARADFAAVTRVDTSHSPTPEQVELFSYSEATDSRLVFVNGLLRSDLSSVRAVPDGVVAIGLDEALRDARFSEVVREHLGRLVEHDENGFTALNTAFVGNGALVVIPRGMTVESPLHILFLSHAPQPTAGFPRVLVLAEENSSATIIESYGSLDSGVCFTNAVVEVVLKDGARLAHYRVQDENGDAFHVTTTRANLGR